MGIKKTIKNLLSTKWVDIKELQEKQTLSEELRNAGIEVIYQGAYAPFIIKRGDKMKNKEKQTWKKALENIMDNPDYIEENIALIQEELKQQLVDTDKLRKYISNIEEWTHEIDLAYRRTKLGDIE